MFEKLRIISSAISEVERFPVRNQITLGGKPRDFILGILQTTFSFGSKSKTGKDILFSQFGKIGNDFIVSHIRRQPTQNIINSNTCVSYARFPKTFFRTNTNNIIHNNLYYKNECKDTIFFNYDDTPLNPPSKGENAPLLRRGWGRLFPLSRGRGDVLGEVFRAESPTYISVGQRPTLWNNGGNNEIAGQARNDGNRRGVACRVLTNRNDVFRRDAMHCVSTNKLVIKL